MFGSAHRAALLKWGWDWDNVPLVKGTKQNSLASPTHQQLLLSQKHCITYGGTYALLHMKEKKEGMKRFWKDLLYLPA